MSLILQAALFVVLAGFTVALVTHKERFFRHNHDVWLKLAVGIGFLDFASLLFLIEGLGYDSRLPLIADDVLRFSLQSLALIAGALLAFAGLAEWIPSLVRSNRRLAQSQAIAGLVARMRSTVANWTAPAADLVEEFSSQIEETLHPASGLVFWKAESDDESPIIRRLRDGASLAVDSVTGLEEIKTVMETRESVYLTGAEVSDEMYGCLDLQENDCDVLAVYPIASCGKTYGQIVLAFEDAEDFSPENFELMGFGIEAVAHTMLSLDLRSDLIDQIASQDTYMRLQRIASESDDLAAFLSRGFDLITRLVPADMISIAVIEENNSNMRRYSYSESANAISEVGMSLPLRKTAVQDVVRDCRPDIAARISGLTYSDDAWLARCGFSSRMTVPVVVAGEAVAALSFVSLERGQYDESDLSNTEIVATVFASLTGAMRERERYSSRLRAMRDISKITRRFVAAGDSGEFLRKFTRSVVEGLPVTEARVFSYDRALNLVRCIAVDSRRGYSRQDIFRRSHNLDSLRRVSSAVRVGEPVVIRTEDEETLSSSEMSMLSSFKASTVIIVPLTVRSSLEGLLVLSEIRSWDRRPFDREDLSLVSMLATQASVMLALMGSPSRPTRHGVQEVRSEIGSDDIDRFAFADISRRLKDPLTSILGAAELLETSLPVSDSPMSRCVRTIRRNADRVARAFNRYGDYVNSHRT